METTPPPGTFLPGEEERIEKTLKYLDVRRQIGGLRSDILRKALTRKIRRTRFLFGMAILILALFAWLIRAAITLYD